MLNTHYAETNLGLRLIVPGRGHIKVPASLHYDTKDPYALTLTMVTGPENAAVSWVFSRDLLIQGSRFPIGEGDVRVWPLQEGDRSVVLVFLSSPSGSALLETDTTEIKDFLEKTLKLVPSGKESLHLDIDQELELFLTS